MMILNLLSYTKLLGNTVAQPDPNAANGILKKCNNCCAIKIFK